MFIIWRAAFWFLTALALAIVEIEVEGKYGWSEKTQTWYRTASHHPKWWLMKLIGIKPLTGYHIAMFFLVFWISHAHFFMGVPWTIKAELLTLALFMTWVPLEDNLWFFFNPHYQAAKFETQVWWYKKWLWKIFPWEDVVQWVIALCLAAIAGYVEYQMLFMVSLMGLAILSILVVAPLFKKYYRTMRLHDDRRV